MKPRYDLHMSIRFRIFSLEAHLIEIKAGFGPIQNRVTDLLKTNIDN